MTHKLQIIMRVSRTFISAAAYMRGLVPDGQASTSFREASIRSACPHSSGGELPAADVCIHECEGMTFNSEEKHIIQGHSKEASGTGLKHHLTGMNEDLNSALK